MALSTEEYFQRGVEKAQQGLLEEAIIAFSQVIQVAPNDLLAYFNRGVLKSELGDKNAAIVDFNHAIEIDPNYAKAYVNRGIAKADMGDKNAAIADFNRAIEINPNDVLAYNNRGLAKSTLGDKNAAIADFNHAIEIDPNYAKAYNDRGSAKSALGDNYGAIGDYDEAIRLYPNYASAYYDRGTTKSMLGDYKVAIADFNHAIEINPNDAKAYNNRGLAKSMLGNYTAAIADYNQAIEIDPNFALAYVNRSIAHQTLGNLYLAQLDINRFFFLASRQEFLQTTRTTFSFYQGNPAPYLLHRTLQKFTENFEQFNTVHPIVDATQQQCRPWKIWEEWRRLAGSEKHETLAHYHALALMNLYMGDPIEAFRLYDEVLDNEEAVGVPLNFMGQYYFIESAKLFREPHEAILDFALQQIEDSKAELIAQNALRELYYVGQILWANDQPEAAHEYFEMADEYLPAAYMQVLSLPAIGADAAEIQAKIAEIREREAALPPNEGFLRGFPARPFRLEKPGEDFFAPILHYAHYREIAEALAEVRQPGEPFEHFEMWKTFYWLPEDKRKIEWQQRREQLAEINRALLGKFRESIGAGEGVHELSVLERAFADKLSHDLWEGTKYLGFEDFKQKNEDWPDAAKDLAALIRTGRRLDDNDKMLLVEYCFLRNSISIEDTFLLYFYIDFVKHPLLTDAAGEGFGEAGQELVKLVVAPDTIFGEILTAFGGGAAVRLFGDFWVSRHRKDHINMDDYAVSATRPTAAPDDFDLFVDNFLRFMSYRRENLGEEKFEEVYPLDGFEDWKRKSK